jgi:hypothetical protein
MRRPIHGSLSAMIEVNPMNKSQVSALLASNPRAIELALLGLLARQTPGERNAHTTVESNGRGFNKNHAEFGTSLAMWVKRGSRLTPRQQVAAVKLCSFYWRQVGQMPEVRALVTPQPLKVEGIYTEGGMVSYIRDLDPFQSDRHAAGWCESRA